MADHHAGVIVALHAPVPSVFSAYLGMAILCLLITGCSTSTGAGSTAASAAAPQAVSPPGDLGKQPNYRQVVIAAQSHDNHPLPKLTAADLSLDQGNKRIPIAFFQPQPAAVGILVDTSGSMEPKLPLCRRALKTFIDDLNPSDEIALFAFSDRPFILEKWTTDHAAVIRRLALLRAFGRTALYDSLTDMLIFSSYSHIKRKAILLITDGMDDASTARLEHVEELARKGNIPIYSIGIGNPKINPSNWLGSMTSDMEALDTKALTALAADTGGETFVVTLDKNGTALEQAATAIAGKIDNRYVVGFVGDGSTNQLRVEAPNGKGVALKVIGAD